MLLVAGGRVVARARVELEGAQVPPANCDLEFNQDLCLISEQDKR